MANTVPATYTAPELSGLVPRDPILASDAQGLLDACNYLIASGAPCGEQCWNRAEGIFARTSNLYSAAGNAAWRIPPLGARTDVTCVALVDVTGASGRVRVASVNSGLSTTSALLAPGEQWVTLALTCAFGPGYDDVELYVIGDAADPIKVYTFFAEFAPLAGPLAAGTGTDDVTAFDAAEASADEPISADMLDYLRRNLIALLARVRGVFMWSGLNDVDDAGAGPQAMPSWAHRVWSHVLPGGEAAGQTWQVYVNAVNTSGVVDQEVVVWHGGGDLEGRSEHRTSIDVPAAAVAATWYAKTVVPGEERPLAEIGVPHMLASVGVFPEFNLFSTLGTSGSTSAAVWSISVWGR